VLRGDVRSRAKMVGVAQPTTRTAPDLATVRDALRTLRPELSARFEDAIPGARAAVLSRLLGALDREPLPGLLSRSRADRSRADHSRADHSRADHSQADHSPTDNSRAHRSSTDPSPTDSSRARHVRATFTGGRAVEFAAAAGQAFARPEPGLTAHVTTPGPAREPQAPQDDPGALVRALWPGSTLAIEVDNSVANLALARAAAPPAAAHRALADAAGDPDGLGRLEQLVTDGHPLHPCCRTRAGLSTADVLAYAPEHRPVIRLRRLRVPPDRWYGDCAPVLYAHPGQADRLRDAYPWITDDGATAPVRPLMSLRTVAPLDGGDHYKTAVDVQMTSAVRTVSPAAVHNGPRLSTLLAALTADLPLSVLAETAAGAVIVDGEPQRHLAHLRREAPRIAADEAVLPLGALAVPGLLQEAAGGDPYGWFADLAVILWTPLVTVLGRGVALEAHGQNTLVVLRAGRPVRILYRDLGGVRVSARRLRAAGVEPPDLRGDLPSDDPGVLRTKLAASALGTVAAELITLLARLGTDPARLWATVAAAIRSAGTPDVAPLLRDPLPIKATTAMRLATDPLADLWAYTDNPLGGPV